MVAVPCSICNSALLQLCQVRADFYAAVFHIFVYFWDAPSQVI